MVGPYVSPLPLRAAARRARARKAPPPAPAPSPWIYRRNLILFILVMVLVMAWFENHLRLYVTGTRLISGTMTLWGLWKLAQSGLHWGVDTKPLAQRVLGRGWATELLAFALLVVVVLNLTTSSIYLEYEDPRGKAPEVTAQAWSGSRPFVPPWTVRSYDSVVGRPFFLRWKPEPLVFELTQPRGYLPLSRVLARGRSLYLRVPADFARKRLVVLCLVPSPLMYNELPRGDDQPAVRYSVHVLRERQEWVFDDVRRSQMLCTGAGAEDLKAEFAGRDQDAFRRRLQVWFTMPGMPAERAEEKVRLAESNARLQASAEFASGDQVIIDVLRGAEPASLRRTISLSSEPIQEALF